jgi:hypothetical protein
MSGSAKIVVPGGIRIASGANGGPPPPGCTALPCAGVVSNNNDVTSSYTYVYGSGGVEDPAQWHSPGQTTTNVQNRSKQSLFDDPYAGMGQPPLTSSALASCPVLGGSLDGSKTPIVLGPGNYYAVAQCANNEQCTVKATGQPITLTGNVTFSATQSGTVMDYSGGLAAAYNNCQTGGTPVGATGSQFGNYVLWGGLTNQGNGNSTNPGVATLDPGRYVMVGSMSIQNNYVLSDGSTAQGPSGGPGVLLILSGVDSVGNTYPGLGTQLSTLPLVQQKLLTASGFGYNSSNLQAGTQTQSPFLHGIDPTNPTIQNLTDTNTNVSSPSKLGDYGNIVIWQDQRNSDVTYSTPDGIPSTVKSPQWGANLPLFSYSGSLNSVLYGVLYQPRGAWLDLQGGGGAIGSNRTQIVTGGLVLGGSQLISFGNVAIPPVIRVNALVE